MHNGALRLKIVLLSTICLAVTTFFITGWYVRANKKHTFVLLKMSSKRSSLKSNSQSSFSSKSKLPFGLFEPLFPCFTTGTPPADKTNAAVVDTLNRSKPLPPVPHESMTLEGRGTGLDLANKALENPRISSAVSPFSENAMSSSAICLSGRLLSRIALRHCSASSA